MYKALLTAVALAVATPATAQAQCYQGCAAVLGFFGGLFAGAALAQPRTVVVTQPYALAPPAPAMATSNGCVQQWLGYDQWGRPIMRWICQ